MAELGPYVGGNRPAPGGRRTAPAATWAENLVTVAFAACLIGGLFVDGWAHTNDKPESFFTPWHGLFYSGFLATALWMARMVEVRRGTGRWADGVPTGYGLGLVGAAVFAAGGVGDMVWHRIFGIEVGFEALLSPSHLILLIGGLLVVTSPLRAAWAEPAGQTPTFSAFLPTLASVTLATASVAFFLLDFSLSRTTAMTDAPLDFIARRSPDARVASWMLDRADLEGYAAVVVTTLVLMTPTLLLARRWVLPFGTFTVLFGSVGALVGAVDSFDLGLVVAAPALGGLAGDVLYASLRPTTERPGRLRAFATIVPVALCLSYFAGLRAVASLRWSVELWSGVTIISGLVGLVLSLLVVPPVIPPGAAAER